MVVDRKITAMRFAVTAISLGRYFYRQGFFVMSRRRTGEAAAERRGKRWDGRCRGMLTFDRYAAIVAAKTANSSQDRPGSKRGRSSGYGFSWHSNGTSRRRQGRILRGRGRAESLLAVYIYRKQLRLTTSSTIGGLGETCDSGYDRDFAPAS